MFGEEDAFAALFDLDQPVALPHCIESLVAAEDEVADVVDSLPLLLAPLLRSVLRRQTKQKREILKTKNKKVVEAGAEHFGLDNDIDTSRGLGRRLKIYRAMPAGISKHSEAWGKWLAERRWRI